MVRRLIRTVLKRVTNPRGREITPEDIFLDASNLPSFNVHQFEGRLERPITARSLYAFLLVAFLILFGFGTRAFTLQVAEGTTYAKLSENNRLDHALIFSDRGVIYDRSGALLAWNEVLPDEPFARRVYTTRDGLAHIVGYLNYPKQDASGNFFRDSFVAQAGAEKYFDSRLSGENGLALIEVDAKGEVRSQSAIRPPEAGRNVTLSVDMELTEALHAALKKRAEGSGFRGGAAIIMDVRTGEIIALSSYPEYSAQTITDGQDRDAITRELSDQRKPFLNRALQGLYSPGSVMKPYVAIGALEEGLITPETVIVSDGALRLPNPYDPGSFSVFRDWGPLAHGALTVRDALAVSSNVFFMTAGGGFEGREGLGIERLGEYFRLFGFGTPVSVGGEATPSGTIPSPEWKAETFDGEIWRVGDTYNTAIGQYGMQASLLQLVRAVSAIANGGVLYDPVLERGKRAAFSLLPVEEETLRVVREGMREATRRGTGQALNVPFVAVATKTGTAELGVAKDYVNSLTTGFFPYEDPRYAFVILMEHGPRSNTIGASAVMLEALHWMHTNRPEYLGLSD